ncbi:hypothetical protein MBLNU459_g3941t2 [Dothideomycetes sp. NU459]
MHLLQTLQLYAASSAALVSATNLFVSSYAGNITSLSLTERNGSYTLAKTYTNLGCAPSPSWLTLDASHGTLYCLDEGLTTPNGSLSSYTIAADGELTLVNRATTISGPRLTLRLCSTGSSVSSWTLSSTETGNFSFLQSETFTLAAPGPNAARQDAPHEHEAILDPTGQFVLVPDLGADLVRIFAIDADTDELTPQTPLKVVAGSGPRHGVFYNPYGVVCEGCTSYFYLVTELGNTVTGYAVSYPAAGGMSFKQVYESSVYGNLTMPAGNAAAEIAVSPDNQYLTISNRNNTSFSLPNPNASNTTRIPSDSLSTFALHHDGTLSFRQLWPSGGSYPRQFAFNKVGNLVAVGLQYGSEVVVMARDVVSGKIGKPVARVAIEGQVTSVQWDE